MNLLFYLLFSLTPLIFSPFSSEIFELPKTTLLYLFTTLIFILHLKSQLKLKSSIFPPPKHLKPFLFFIFIQIVSTAFSTHPLTSVFGYYSRFNGGLLTTICFFLIFCVLYFHTNASPTIIKSTLLSSLLVSLYAILEHFGIDKNFWAQDVQSRVFSTLGQPNWLAAYLCIIIPISIYFSNPSVIASVAKQSHLTTPRQLPGLDNVFKHLLYLIPLIHFIALLFTASRTGIIACFFSLFINIIFYFIFQKSNFKKLLIYFLFFIFLSISIDNPIRQKLFPSSIPPQTISQNSYQPLVTSSLDIRKIVWKGAFDIFKKYPLFGSGPETFSYTYYQVRPATHNLTSEWDFIYNKAHNEYLNYLANTGIFGLVSYLTLIVFFVYLILKNPHPLKYPILASFISILITNFTGFSVIVISLHFFTLPLIFQNSSVVASVAKQSPSNKKIISLLISFISIILIFKILSFFLADIFHNFSTTLSSSLDQTKLESAYTFSTNAYSLCPYQTDFLYQKAKSCALFAAVSKSRDQANTCHELNQKLYRLNPVHVNYLKSIAQNYYYLASLDLTYIKYSLYFMTEATKLAPTDARSFFLLAQFYDIIKDYQTASKYYSQAIILKSNYDHAYFALAIIQFNQKDLSAAKSNFQKALDINPQNRNAQEYLQKITPNTSPL